MTPQRLVELAALLPLLHVPPGSTTVVVAGPLATVMAVEALRWRDTDKILTLLPLPVNDRRVEVVKDLVPGSASVVLLSPEQDPAPWLKALRPGGIIQALTGAPERFRPMLTGLKAQAGNAVPWRGHLPQPVYGVIAALGSPQPVKRLRKVPKGSSYLSEQFMPSLFTFAKDELSLAFGPTPS